MDCHSVLFYKKIPTIVEYLSFVFNLLGVWLTAKRSIWCWSVGIVGILLFAYTMVESRLYADAFLQVIFFLQGIYGWYVWHLAKREVVSGEKEEGVPFGIRNVTFRESAVSVVAVFVLTFALGFFLKTYTNADLPYIDSFLMSVSIIANWMAAVKILQNWLLWIFADFLYVPLFYYKGLYSYSVLYAVFLIMAVVGYRAWRMSFEL